MRLALVLLHYATTPTPLMQTVETPPMADSSSPCRTAVHNRCQIDADVGPEDSNIVVGALR